MKKERILVLDLLKKHLEKAGKRKGTINGRLWYHSNLSLLYKITAKFLNLFLIDTNSP